MQIRSVTLFATPATDPAACAPFMQAARHAFHVPVQTVRVALPPFADWLPARDWLPAATRLTSAWRAAGADYVNLGTLRLHDDPAWLARIPALIATSDALFASAEIADRAGQIDPARCRAVADVVHALSTQHANGFGNLYFTAIANCPPGSPFFPVAYGNGQSAFALALEAADLARIAFQPARTLAEARSNLVHAVEAHAGHLAAAAARLAAEFDIPFGGSDFSLTPFPTDDRSLGGALEDLGAPHVGAAGSLFGAALVADALQAADFTRCGFSGVMLPVLEDSVLAARAAAGQLDISALLTYAAVCGVGLDTIPLAGDTTPGQIAALLLDVAALAVRLNKPLTARLMPLPGLRRGDATAFDFAYFANSRALAIAGAGVGGLLATDDPVQLHRYAQMNDRTSAAGNLPR